MTRADLALPFEVRVAELKRGLASLRTDLPLFSAAGEGRIGGPRQESDDDLGTATFIRLLAPDAWVNRRVETIQFVGEGRVRRRVSVDFLAPPADGAGDNSDGASCRLLVPVTLLRKEILTGFSVVDEEGTTLSMLTTLQNGHVAWSALVAGAAGALSLPASTELREALWQIAVAPAAYATAVLDRLATGVPRPAAAAEVTRLRASPDYPNFLKVATDLSVNFLMLVPVRAGANARVVKFTYDEPATEPPRRPVALGGIRDAEYELPISSVGLGGSYHLELEPPVGVMIPNARLEVEGSDGRRRRGVLVGSERLAHLYLGELPPGGADGSATFALRPQPTGLLRTAALVGTFATVVLGAGIPFLGRLSGSSSAEAAVALLLVVPGAVAALLARPNEHLTASAVLLGTRLLAAVVAVVLYAAAGVLVVGVKGGALVLLWGSSALVSAGATAALWRGYRRSNLARWTSADRRAPPVGPLSPP